MVTIHIFVDSLDKVHKFLVKQRRQERKIPFLWMHFCKKKHACSIRQCDRLRRDSLLVILSLQHCTCGSNFQFLLNIEHSNPHNLLVENSRSGYIMSTL